AVVENTDSCHWACSYAPREKSNEEAGSMSTYTGNYESDRAFGWKLFAVVAGFLIPFVMVIGLWLAISAHNARDDARNAAASAKSATTADTQTSSMPGMSTATAGTATAGMRATPSFAGVAPANAEALAMKHAATRALLPPAPAGSVANVR